MRGAETECVLEGGGGGGETVSRPTPRLRTTGSRCCPLPPTAPRTPLLRRAPSWASGAPRALGPWEPELRHTRTDPFPVRKLAVTSEKVRWANSVPAGVGHISLVQ